MQEVQTKKPIPFIDLAIQQSRIRPQVEAAITQVLDHGKFIMGPEVQALEAALCEYTGVKHAISCSSGTDALLMALMAYGIGPGDAVMVPAFTFTATPEVVALLGATPVFIDVDSKTYNVCPKSVALGMNAAKSAGLTMKGIIAADIFGQAADYDALQGVAAQYDLWILADAAQSFGATSHGNKVGTLAEVTATSFFPAKPLGCYGDGGCVFTDNDELANVLRSLRVHGKGTHKYDNVRIGINGRLDTIQAAILLEKLRIYPEELEMRQQVAANYSDLLSGKVVLPVVLDHMSSAWAQYTVQLPKGSNRDGVQLTMKQAGVPTAVYYPKPLHQQTAYQHYPRINDLACCERLSTCVLSLPMYPYLSKQDQAVIADQLLIGLS